MKRLIHYLAVASLVLTGAGCNYLDMVPEDDIETIETIFEKREDAEEWLKTCYVALQNNCGSVNYDPAFTGADEVVCCEAYKSTGQGQNERKGPYISEGLQTSQKPFGTLIVADGSWRDNMYTYINYCNIFLEQVWRIYNMPSEEKALWAAEVRVLKAHIYYELMKHYGPIILVDKNIPVGAPVEEMRQPRSPMDSCVNATLRLIDESLADLLPRNQKDMPRQAYHSLESAYALRAKVLLLAASPQFNGNKMYAGFKNRRGEQLVAQEYDAEKWRLAAEAADKAIEVCKAGGMDLIEGTARYSTALRNTMEDVSLSYLANNYNNKEAVYMIRMRGNMRDMWANGTLPVIRANEDPEQANSYLQGGVGVSLDMVERFYTDKGLPIDRDKTWPYSDRYRMAKEMDVAYENVMPINVNMLQLHLRREPRFYADVAADRCYWQRGPQSRHLLQVLPYRNELMGTTYSTLVPNALQNVTGYFVKKGSYSDVTGQNYDNVFGREEGLILFRMAELYLISAEAWNEYSGPGDKVYAPLNRVRERAGIPDVLTAWKTYSTTPQQVDTKEGMREIIHDEWNVEFAFEGMRFWNVRRWWTAHEELNHAQLGWNILGEDAEAFYNGFEGPITVGAKCKFTAPRDYLFPFEAEQVMISGITQNPGW